MTLAQSASIGTRGLQPIDIVDRLAIAYLTLPVLLFFLGWFSLPVGACLAGLLFMGLAPLLHPKQGSARFARSWGVVLVSVVVAFAWSALGGAGHFLYANSDWPIRDAVLRDLVVAGWPPGYGTIGGVEVILRTPVAYYLPAALLGKMLGLQVADVMLFMWTAIGVSFFLAIVLSLTRNARDIAIAIALVVFFSGMDVFGIGRYFLARPPLTQHLEWWAQIFQYSANTTQLFWVPNHALPGWLMSAMIYKHWRNPEFLKVSPIAFGATALWSPLVTVGLAPFAILILVHNVRNNTWRSRALLLSLPAAFVTCAATAYYLVVDSGGIRSGSALGAAPSLDGFITLYVKFVLLEFGFLAAAVCLLKKPDAPTIVAMAALLIFPFYRFGPGNDLVMRASIPALMILCLWAAHALSHIDWNDKPIRVAPLLACLTFGSVTAIHEMARSVLLPRWAPVLNRNLVDVSRGLPAHYVARMSPLLTKLMRTPQPVQGARLNQPATKASKESGN